MICGLACGPLSMLGISNIFPTWLRYDSRLSVSSTTVRSTFSSAAQLGSSSGMSLRPPNDEGKYVGNAGGPHNIRKVCCEYPKPLSHIFDLWCAQERHGRDNNATPPHDNGRQVGNADGPYNKRQKRCDSREQEKKRANDRCYADATCGCESGIPCAHISFQR